MVRPTLDEINARSRNSLPLFSRPLTGYGYDSFYSVTGCIFVRRAVWDRVRFSSPPPPSGTLYIYPVERWVPTGGGGGGGGLCPYKNATNARITYFRLTSTLRTLYEHREAFVWTPYESSLERRSYERRKGPARTTWGILTITVGILGFWNCLLTVNNLA